MFKTGQKSLLAGSNYWFIKEKLRRVLFSFSELHITFSSITHKTYKNKPTRRIQRLK